MTMSFLRTAAVAAAAAALLGGCVQASNLNRDFGRAYHENIVAQVADPDARYKGDPDPGTNGARVALAQERYRTGKVIRPVPATASTISMSAASPAPAE
jgi:hypothetical protein